MTATATSPIDTIRALAAEQLARDAWSREQLLDHQARRLTRLLAHAVVRSPYYLDTLGADAPRRPLSELPTLSKATLMEHWDRIVCDPRLRLADVEAHATGPRRRPAGAAPGRDRRAARRAHVAADLRGAAVRRRRSAPVGAHAARRDGGGAERVPAGGRRRLPQRRLAARGRAARRPAGDRAAQVRARLRAGDTGGPRARAGGVGDRSGRVLREHRAARARNQHRRPPALARAVRGPRRVRGRRRRQPARAARHARQQDPADQPRELHAAADPLRAGRPA